MKILHQIKLIFLCQCVASWGSSIPGIQKNLDWLQYCHMCNIFRHVTFWVRLLDLPFGVRFRTTGKVRSSRTEVRTPSFLINSYSSYSLEPKEFTLSSSAAAGGFHLEHCHCPWSRFRLATRDFPLAMHVLQTIGHLQETFRVCVVPRGSSLFYKMQQTFQFHFID